MANPPRPQFDVPGAVGYECKHVVYSTAADGSPHDLLTIKEVVHFEDGTTKPRLSFYGDYKRNFWVTKPIYRNHTDKKEWEYVKKCDVYSTTQVELTKRIVQALGFGDPTRGLKQLAASQYLYGADISTPCLMKANYMNQWPLARSKNSVAVFDCETNMNDDKEYPIITTLSMKEKAIIAVDSNWYGPSADAKSEIYQSIHKYLEEHITKRNINVEVVMCDGPVEIIRVAFERAHEWMPDIVEIWNQNFDIPKMLNTLRDFGVDPRDIFCDPSVPRKFRRCEYEEGATRKKAASGREIGINPAEQWHTLRCTASFYVLCGMCAYKRVRLAGGNDFSYGLDDVLARHCDLGKLRFKEAESSTILEGGKAWHELMQSTFRKEYCAYALFDSIGTEILDEKINDLSTMVSTLCGWSEYSNYNRQPTMLVNDLHFFALARGQVIGTGGKTVSTELDDETLDLTGWIVSLASYLIVNNGLPAFKGIDDLFSMIRAHVADLDVKSAYPFGGIIMNISRETTEGELCGIEGISEATQRRSGINLMSATTNAVEICTDIYGLPQMHTLYTEFVTEHQLTKKEMA